MGKSVNQRKQDHNEGSPPGKELERAVHLFAAALDPKAEVLFDHRVPDRDTGELRQVDVWINAKIGNHIPYSVLISCKDYRRPISVPHIDQFIGELRSTGANVGVIYSGSGFTRTAKRKAQSNSIVCCKLYDNRPADMPDAILFPSFLCKARFGIDILHLSSELDFKHWNDFFDFMPLGTQQNLLDMIALDFRSQEKAITAETACRNFPRNWIREYSICEQNPEKPIIVFRVRGVWAKYRGRIEAHLLKGSYCFSNSEFFGSQSGPVIDTQGKDPGPDWEEISESTIALPDQYMVAILTGGDLKNPARESLGLQPIRCSTV